MSVFLCCHKERIARSSQQGELRMKRPGIMAMSVALAMGLATTAWAAEGADSGTAGGTSGTGSMESGSGTGSSGMNSNGSGMNSNGNGMKSNQNGMKSNGMNSTGNGMNKGNMNGQN
jgi:hypothetical protein